MTSKQAGTAYHLIKRALSEVDLSEDERWTLRHGLLTMQQVQFRLAADEEKREQARYLRALRGENP